MAMGLRHHRSRSTSNILGEGVELSQEKLSTASQKSQSTCSINDTKPTTADERYKTYNIEDLKEARIQFAKDTTFNLDEKKEPTTPKPQNLVRKLIASLELKTNSVCEANDEFHATYYPRNNYANSNHQPFEKIQMKSLRESDIRRNRSFAHYETIGKIVPEERLKAGESFKFDKLPRNRVIFKNKLETSPDESTSLFDRSYESLLNTEACSRNDRRKKPSRSSGKDDDERRISSYFDRTRCHVGMRDIHFSSLTKIDKYYDDNCFDQKVGNLSGSMDLTYKKPSRKKSFKDFLGSIVKCSFRRKSRAKEINARRCQSSDDLLEEATRRSTRNLGDELSRTTSLQEIGFQESQDERRENFLMRAAENQRYDFPLKESVENLVKPSAIKNLTKRVPSQLREEWSNNAKLSVQEIRRKSMLETRFYQEISKRID